MPDWFTHIVIGLILVELLPIKKKSLLLLGAILPDIIPKIVLLKLFIPLPSLLVSTNLSIIHTPLIILLSTILLAQLFKYSKYKVILWLNIGAFSHFISDAMLRHFGDAGVRFFYPLSMHKFSYGLFWPNESYWLLIPLLPSYLVIVWLKKIINHNLNKINKVKKSSEKTAN